MTNFDFLLPFPEFAEFAESAISAEHILHIDRNACVISCRRSMEFAVKWMFDFDRDLDAASRDNLVSLMRDKNFRNIVGDDVYYRMEYIRRLGNIAAHSGVLVTLEEAELCLENLHAFLDFLAYCYKEEYQGTRFDKSLLELTVHEALSFVSDASVEVKKTLSENDTLVSHLKVTRSNKAKNYHHLPVAHDERKLRRLYVELMLKDAGWVIGQSAVKKDDNYYLLDGKSVLALVYVFSDIESGKEGAIKLARKIKSEQKSFLLVFLTNGIKTFVLEDFASSTRQVTGIYSKKNIKKYQHFKNNKNKTN